MTSPTQLKYLHAMGIPVWVSRELIIENEISHELVPASPNPQVVTSLPFPNLVNKTSSSAQSILETLDDNSSKIRSRVVNLETNSTLDEAVAESVNSSKIEDESISVSSAVPTLVSQNLLIKSSQHYVYTSGSETSDWMIIGHSPEPFNGIGQEPFAGEAGELLNNMLRAVGIDQPRKDAYLLNVIDINQSVNKDQEVFTKSKLKLKHDLLAVIDKVKPKIILFMGQIAPQNLLDSSDPLIIMRSKVHTISDNNIPCVVTYYPSYLLQKPTDKRKAWDDLKLAMSQITDVS